jgi:DNA-directed RNA polymerase subunit L
MLIAAPMGMGKTRSLNEAKKTFTENDWKWYYGDCDEIQDENSVSFEPFLEAFKNLLKVEEFVDRSLQMESISGDAVKAITDIAGGPSDMINDFKRDESLTMTEICVEIAEKLESSKNKTVFVMEDLHWIDPESYAFLKHFIKTVNRNDFIRKNMCIILTIRNDEVNNLRGVNLQGLKDDLMALNKNLDTKAIITDLLIEDSFKVKDFINHVSNQNVQFKIQDDSLADINYKLNSSLLDKNSTLKITPLYILKIVEQWIQNKVLKYTPDGYVLTDSIESIELPNTKEIDSYYHAILEGFDVKWARMLESAAIIGSKFNADILSQVWGFELLEILGFLEEAEAKGLIVDLSEEDNIYEFSDKRIVSAIKSYFPSSQNSGVKQIIIEYNKRYIDLKKDIINVPSEYSLEEILSVVRRLTLMSSSSSYNEATKRLIFEIIVRMILNEEHEKINAFESFLRNRNLIELSDLIAIINTIANPNTPFNEVIKQGNELLRKEYSSDSVELELKIYGLMFKQTRFGSQYENNEDSFVKTNELFFIGEKINTLYKGEVLLSLGFLYLNCAQFSFEEAKSFLNKLSENLKDHSNFKAFSYYIEHWIISTTLSQNYDVDEVDQSSETLLKEAIATKNLRLIKKCLKLRILIVTKYIKDKEKAVVIFTENIAHLKTNSINNHWVSSVLYFFATWSGEIYCKNNPEQAEIDLKLCEEFIYKRFDANVWTKLIEEFYNAKKKFHKSTDQLDAFKSTCYEHKELISNTIGEKTKQYGDACFHIANYHLLVKEYESSLEYRLLRIKNYEDLYVNKPKPWSLQAAYMSTSFFYSKYLKDYKNGIDYALKALEVLNNTQGIPDYFIAATYNRVFKAYIELEEYNAAIELALKHFEEVKNTENVPDVKLGFAYNLIAISYKWSAEKIKDKKIASSYFVAAIKHFNLAITSWSEDTNDQNLKRARATINVGLCENEVLRIGLETKSINAKKIIEMIEKGLKEIKEPKLESFLTKPTKALIEKAEVTLLNLSK